MRRFRDLISAHKRFSFGVWIVVLVAVVAGAQWQLAGRGSSPLQARVLGATAKKPPAVPTITSGPSDPTNSASATFVFKSTPTPGGYLCNLDNQPSFSACSSPKTYTLLADGPHSFQVEAQDSGLTSEPAARSWMVHLTPPLQPTITDKPQNPTYDTTAHFAYYSQAGATFACQLDSATPTTCGSSVDYSKLSFGDHTFSVVATDGVGTHSSPASYTWTVLQNKAFGISGNAIGPLFLDVTQGLALQLSNPYKFTIRVDSVHVAVTRATPATCDLAVANLTLVDLSVPVAIPAYSSVTLGSSLQPTDAWPTGWPSITMVNSVQNQNDCKGTTFTLSYTGTATTP
jgi:hypothetical protein